MTIVACARGASSVGAAVVYRMLGIWRLAVKQNIRTAEIIFGGVAAESARQLAWEACDLRSFKPIY